MKPRLLLLVPLAACTPGPEAAPPSPAIDVPPAVAARLPEGLPPSAVRLQDGCYTYTLNGVDIGVFDMSGNPICL